MSRLVREVRVGSVVGLHARPAAKVARLARSANASVTLTKDGRTVDAASLLGILSLNAHYNELVVLSVDGPDAAEVMDQLVFAIASGEI